MAKQKSLKLNAMLNLIKVGLSVVYPLITFPYATRILQVANMGKVSYGDSIIKIFMLIASLGITNYAVREGSKYRENRTKLNQFSREVFSINLLSTLISYICLAVFCVVSVKMHDYATLVFIQSLSIIFATLGVEWVNAIHEDYLYITIRSIIIQTIGVILLFFVVKTKDDYLKYAGLTVFVNGLVCVSNMLHVRRYVSLKPTLKLNLKRHLKPIMLFFSNSIAVLVYVSADMTMLGWISGDFYTGLYAVSVKVYSVVKQMLGAIYMVTIPRLSKAATLDDKTEFRHLLTEISSFLLLLMIPMCMGLGVLSKNIVYILSGEKFIAATLSLQILAVSVFFAITGGVITTCMNVPLGKEALNLKATTISAFVNVGLNLVFIPLWQQNGAAMTTALSELVVVLVCLFEFKEAKFYFEMDKLFYTAKFAVAGALWILLTKIVITKFITNYTLNLLAVFFISVIGYTLILFFGKNEVFIETLKKTPLKKLVK
ncbi:MAG: flippase [Finegoldia magna]|uniref:flippase n=1 Tax=Finegoldia magna TaxID=1260 RepID=UPI000B917678|nr:flippase [Finegoldia magna]MDU2132230.1 flippase [Finegoldia magna]OXZ33326.1 peptide-binding protein [Finegoldia magna]